MGDGLSKLCSRRYADDVRVTAVAMLMQEGLKDALGLVLPFGYDEPG
jgi:hypothetical protein